MNLPDGERCVSYITDVIIGRLFRSKMSNVCVQDGLDRGYQDRNLWIPAFFFEIDDDIPVLEMAVLV